MKVFIAVLAAVLLFVGSLHTQITIPSVVDIGITEESADVLLVYAPTGYSAYQTSTINMSVQQVAPSDSLVGQTWNAEYVDSIAPNKWIFRVTGKSRSNPTSRYITYLDTTDFGGAGYINVPDRNTELPGGAPITYLVPRTGSWRINFNTGSSLKGARIAWYFTRVVPARADSLGRIQTVPVLADSLNTY